MDQKHAWADGDGFADDVLDALDHNGVPRDRERPFTFYLYVPAKRAADECAARLAAEGLDCRVEVSAADDGSWLCRAHAHLVPDRKPLASLGMLLLQLATVHDGLFDGWEVAQEAPADMPQYFKYLPVAQRVLESVRGAFLPAHEYAEVDAREFDHLDQRFYARLHAAFERLGFEFLADMEDRTISARGRITTCIRTLRHPERQCVAAMYYVPPRESGIFEIETFLSDGNVLVSTMAPEGNRLADWPLIRTEHYPPDIDPAALFEAHEKSLARLLDGTPQRRPLAVTDFAGLAHAQNRMNAHKHDHLRSRGWVTRDYLLAQTGGDDALADGVLAAIGDLLKREEPRSAS